MISNYSRFISASLLLLTAFSTAASIEFVTSTAVAETKVQACENALDIARREAAQTAATFVESTFSSIESERGTSHREDIINTTKAFAKLLDKTEKISLEENTGFIRCEVTAQFEAGFVEDSEHNKIKPAGDRTTTHETAFTAGKPFCSKLLQHCFREFYAKDLGIFGIQAIDDHINIPNDTLNPGYGFYHTGLLITQVYDFKKGMFVETDTQAKFEDAFLSHKERILQLKMTLIDYKGYLLTPRGYETKRNARSNKEPFDIAVLGDSRNIGLFVKKPLITDEDVKKIDEEIAKIYNSLNDF